ncbi:hypothetical protein BJ741DRAFT_612919 [Chytriomyces cf. hyalinus JEL632]|nr:hypothetical protein BJ741DRAFT_612919 [Chytriomyces cf. hyalinus JEL632]
MKPTMTPSSTPVSAPSEDFFGSTLLEEDFFSFTGVLSLLSSYVYCSNLTSPQSDFTTTPTPTNSIVKLSPTTPNNKLSKIDLTDDLVNQIIGCADPTVLSLFDAQTGAVFQSLFPETLPLKNGSAAPMNVRLLGSANADLITPSPAMTIQATPFLGLGSPEDSLAFLMSPESNAADAVSPLMNMHSEAFAVPWDSSMFFPTATVPAPASASEAGSPSVTEEKPKSKAGRKRKERPNDPDEIIKELDMKRQRNTESARRSRVKRMAELDELHRTLASAQQGEQKALEKIKSLEAELEKAKRLLALAGERLKGV